MNLTCWIIFFELVFGRTIENAVWNEDEWGQRLLGLANVNFTCTGWDKELDDTTFDKTFFVEVTPFTFNRSADFKIWGPDRHHNISICSPGPQFEEGSLEFGVDDVPDKEKIIAYAVVSHIEDKGVHSGDASLCISLHNCDDADVHKIADIGIKLAARLDVSAQILITPDEKIQAIECNVHVSRSLPFMSKTTGIDFINLGTNVYLDTPYTVPKKEEYNHVGVKCAQFSFTRLPGSDPTLGVEMTSTGAVACFGENMHEVFLKAMIFTHFKLPRKNILLSAGGEDTKPGFIRFTASSTMNDSIPFADLVGRGPFRCVSESSENSGMAFDLGRVKIRPSQKHDNDVSLAKTCQMYMWSVSTSKFFSQFRIADIVYRDYDSHGTTYEDSSDFATAVWNHHDGIMSIDSDMRASALVAEDTFSVWWWTGLVRPRPASTYTVYSGLQDVHDRADDSVVWSGLSDGLQVTYFEDSDLSLTSAVSARWVGFAQPVHVVEYTFFVEILRVQGSSRGRVLELEFDFGVIHITENLSHMPFLLLQTLQKIGKMEKFSTIHQVDGNETYDGLLGIVRKSYLGGYDGSLKVTYYDNTNQETVVICDENITGILAQCRQLHRDGKLVPQFGSEDTMAQNVFIFERMSTDDVREDFVRSFQDNKEKPKKKDKKTQLPANFKFKAATSDEHPYLSGNGGMYGQGSKDTVRLTMKKYRLKVEFNVAYCKKDGRIRYHEPHEEDTNTCQQIGGHLYGGIEVIKCGRIYVQSPFGRLSDKNQAVTNLNGHVRICKACGGVPHNGKRKRNERTLDSFFSRVKKPRVQNEEVKSSVEIDGLDDDQFPALNDAEEEEQVAQLNPKEGSEKKIIPTLATEFDDKFREIEWTGDQILAFNEFTKELKTYLGSREKCKLKHFANELTRVGSFLAERDEDELLRLAKMVQLGFDIRLNETSNFDEVVIELLTFDSIFESRIQEEHQGDSPKNFQGSDKEDFLLLL